MEKPKIFIACPAFGQNLNSQTAASLIAITKEFSEFGIFGGFSALSFPDIADLRNVFTSVWYYKLDATHILMVDADMQFEPELIWDMLEADKPVVGCLYPKKRLPISFVGSALDEQPEPEGNLLELEGVGCGVILIRRDAIDNMIATGNVEVEEDTIGVAGDMIRGHGVNKMIRAFDLVKDGRRRLSEDYSFCWRHRKSGGKIWSVINHTLCHLGLFQFAGKYSDLYKAKEANGPI